MITWRFKRANKRHFDGTRHAFSSEHFPEMSVCGKASLFSTTDHVPGYQTLPGKECKTCRRMVNTQQDFQVDPGGGR